MPILAVDIACRLLSADVTPRRQVAGDPCQHRRRDGADAVVRADLQRAAVRVREDHLHPVVGDGDLLYLGAVADRAAQRARQCVRNAVHPADRLEHHHCLVPAELERKVDAETRGQQVGQCGWVGGRPASPGWSAAPGGVR
jgi:hypothetical protein